MDVINVEDVIGIQEGQTVDEVTEKWLKDLHAALKARIASAKIYVRINADADELIVVVRHFTYDTSKIGITKKFENARSYMIPGGITRILYDVTNMYLGRIKRVFFKYDKPAAKEN